jgi:hypothetical protein
MHCTYRADQNQVTIRAAITDTTRALSQRSLTPPEQTNGTPKAAPENFDEPTSAAIATQTPWIFHHDAIPSGGRLAALGGQQATTLRSDHRSSVLSLFAGFGTAAPPSCRRPIQSPHPRIGGTLSIGCARPTVVECTARKAG